MIDTFSTTELYLIASSFNAKGLYGLPDKKQFQLQGEKVFKEAHDRLIAKGFLTENGAFTNEGAFLVEVVWHYVVSKKYVQCNNLMFAFGEADADNVVMLIEMEEQTSYQVHLLEKPLALQLLTKEFAVMRREPLADEKEFLMKELPAEEAAYIEKLGIPNDCLILDIVHKADKPQTKASFWSWVVIIYEEKLIMFDLSKGSFHRTSQYYFMKMIFDAMDFPYRREEGA
ncbi:DUF5081 family protein [Terribacillus saccharophilus]|uniref:DUF5081 family protein n=1 Tax=Terribacillus saccharophilus TaxID=361277 RepID=UPI003982B8F6